MIRQILLGVGFAADTDLDSGEILTSHFGNDGFDAVVPAGRAIGADPQTARHQRYIVKQNDDPLGRDMEVSTQLQHTAAGQVHIGQRLQKQQLAATVIYLTVQALKLSLIHLAAQLAGQNIQCPKTAVVPGLLIFLAGVAQANDEPVFAGLTKHGLE